MHSITKRHGGELLRNATSRCRSLASRFRKDHGKAPLRDCRSFGLLATQVSRLVSRWHRKTKDIRCSVTAILASLDRTCPSAVQMLSAPPFRPYQKPPGIEPPTVFANLWKHGAGDANLSKFAPTLESPATRCRVSSDYARGSGSPDTARPPCPAGFERWPLQLHNNQTSPAKSLSPPTRFAFTPVRPTLSRAVDMYT